MSNYLEVLEEIENLRCPACCGLGECDNGEIDEISYHSWKCGHCKGTGWRDGQTYKPTFVPGNSIR
jgi:hypothetical protein